MSKGLTTGGSERLVGRLRDIRPRGGGGPAQSDDTQTPGPLVMTHCVVSRHYLQAYAWRAGLAALGSRTKTPCGTVVPDEGTWYRLTRVRGLDTIVYGAMLS
jgi:hypothetical protein